MDQHLIAEYRELPRVFTYVRKLQDSGKWPKDIDIPKKFTFSKGHIKFFANKLGWLNRRYLAIVSELKARGFKIQSESLDNKIDGLDMVWIGRWSGPTKEEVEISRNRIEQKIAMKPGWYRKTKYDRVDS